MYSSFLICKQCSELGHTTLVQLLVKLAFVAAVGGVGFEDIAVSGFQFFRDTALVHHTGSAVIGETA